MIRKIALVFACLMFVADLRADEQDELLAKQLAAIVRDPRQQLQPRVSAAKMLGKLGPRATSAVPDLIAELNRLRGTELEALQEACIEALGGIGASARVAMPTLARLTGRSIDIDLAVKKTTSELLATGEGRDLSLLVQQMASRDESVRLRAVKALAAIGINARPAIPYLRAALADPDGDVRRTSLNALRRIQPDFIANDEVIKSIVLDLKDPDPDVRLTAARSLSRLGKQAASAVPALTEAGEDPDRDVRKAVVEALNRIALP